MKLLAGTLLLLTLTICPVTSADVLVTHANAFTQFTFTSTKAYADPFNEVELDVVFTTPSGKELRVPAYWAGGQNWCVRYASPEVGTHSFHTICNDTSNASMHGQNGDAPFDAYKG